MPQFQVRIESEPFRNDPFSIVVEAEDEADAYLTVYDHLTRRGMPLNTIGAHHDFYRWFKPEVKQKISESGLPCQGYPAITHITEVIQLPKTSYGKGKVVSYPI